MAIAEQELAFVIRTPQRLGKSMVFKIKQPQFNFFPECSTSRRLRTL